MSANHVILLNHAVGPELLEVLDELVDGDERAVHVLVPTSKPTAEELDFVRVEGDGVGDDPAVVLARWRLAAATRRLEHRGFTVHGAIGAADPVEAVAAFVAQGWPLAGLVVSTAHPGPSRWFHRDLPSRLERETTLSLAAVVTDDRPLVAA